MPSLHFVIFSVSIILGLIYTVYHMAPSELSETRINSSSLSNKGNVKPFFSFTSPGSLFPPSAIISLTDDNSTFFLARPAAFGPALPEKGLSGPIWVGGGFGEESMGHGELGCSDVPGWTDGGISSTVASGSTPKRREEHIETSGTIHGTGEDAEEHPVAHPDDGTDDHLLPSAKVSNGLNGDRPEHGDIQSLQESGEIAGKVVLLKRGGCGFLEKVKWTQRRGGVALIVGDNMRGAALVRMYAHGDTSNVSIPAVFTSHTTAHLLSSLVPSGNAIHNLSPEDEAKLKLIKSSKRKNNKTKDRTRGIKVDDPPNADPAKSKDRALSKMGNLSETSNENGWLHSLFSRLGFDIGGSPPEKNGQRPPSSGVIDWVFAEHWTQGSPTQTAHKTSAISKPPSRTSSPDDFKIGEQDWRDPDLLPDPSSATPLPTETGRSKSNHEQNSENVIPSSGEYIKYGEGAGLKQKGNGIGKESAGLYGAWRSGRLADEWAERAGGSNHAPPQSTSPSAVDEVDVPPDDPEIHEGLWVTLSPTNMSSSPFFDTLLVLVVSPLVTLTVVYALLLLRSRIRRRRWRAPKSVVERLPVRTYHTISDSSSSSTTPATSSPTAPLLQHSPSRPPSTRSHPRSRTTTEDPATSSSFQPNAAPTEEEKRESGLAEWRRRYGSRQTECVICLEDYQDGVSRVMRLPCGHEFHAECITPWLITRRRTCPICKGDVVRDLSRSYRNRHRRSGSATVPRRQSHQNADAIQDQAAETRNDRPSSSRPVPTGSSLDHLTDEYHDDLEANWADDPLEERDPRGREIPRASHDLSSSVRDLSSTVTTVIWRGVDAIRGAAGLQRRPSQDDVDRDR